jgi:hypothetical protein
MYKTKRNYENLNKWNFLSDGTYGIPDIETINADNCDFIGFNYANTCKNPEDVGVHFYLDDYQFIRVWNDPDRYIQMLKRFKYVMSPDFSLYTDYPVAIQIYNHYRKHWLAAYWNMHGIKVIPTICWSDEDSFKWCFDGEPKGSTVSVSSVGVMKNKEYKRKFIRGYEEMIDRIEPTQIIFYGDIPEECKGNIVHIKSFSDKWNKAEVSQW